MTFQNVMRGVQQYASDNLPPAQLSIGNIVAFAINLLVNYLSQSGYLGKSNAELSANNETPITPAGWTFAIWGLIFLLQAVGSVFGVVKVNNIHLKGSRNNVVLSIGHGWQLGWVFQSLWQLLFLIQTPLGNFLCTIALVLAFLSFLVPLFNLYQIEALHLVSQSPLNYVAYVLPTSMNTAWLNVATPLGIVIMLQSFGLPYGASKVVSTLLLISVVFTGMFMTIVKKDIAYSLTLLWGVQGIRIRHSQKQLISWTSLIGQVLLLCGIIYQVGYQIYLQRNSGAASRLQETLQQGEL